LLTSVLGHAWFPQALAGEDGFLGVGLGVAFHLFPLAGFSAESKLAFGEGLRACPQLSAVVGVSLAFGEFSKAVFNWGLGCVFEFSGFLIFSWFVGMHGFIGFFVSWFVIEGQVSIGWFWIGRSAGGAAPYHGFVSLVAESEVLPCGARI